jgi:hypothetical protein
MERVPRQLGDSIERFGLSDTGLGMYFVPASHKEELDDADLACVHIATGLGVRVVRYFRADDQKLAVCGTCSAVIRAEKAAGSRLQ